MIRAAKMITAHRPAKAGADTTGCTKTTTATIKAG